ncbi:MAG: hypothetical protein OEU26_35110, partial [Candidatus Tectomicrobia bacterium]|nr:hypothetical protein [Candidatus Tectomicrobia bacterium]
MGLELDPIKGVIQLYCSALAGTSIDVHDTVSISDQSAGWVDEQIASTDGAKVFLPPMIDRYPAPHDNFAWYKVIATHQVAHVEFGSFQFAFERPCGLFADRRLNREPDAAAKAASNGLEPLQAYTEIGRFLNLFANRRLAFDLFTILEDCRLDYRINTEYPGIRQAAWRVQAETLAQRPGLEAMPLQHALVELLIQLSLERFASAPVPTVYAETAVMLARIVHRLRTPWANVEDAAEAALRAYEIISHLPNVAQEQWELANLETPGEFSESAFETLMEQLQAMAAGLNGDGEPYGSPAPVDFRGEFKPDMIQMLAQLQMGPETSEEESPMTSDMLEQWVESSVELSLDSDAPDATSSELVEQLMRIAGVPPDDAQPAPDDNPPRIDDISGASLTPSEPNTYAYDEWDFAVNAYRPSWCLVKEQELEEGDPACYEDALKTHNGLLAHIKHQFERIMPERLRKTYRLVDGEDLDLNAALEAWADLRMNLPPDDKIYWQRHRIQRDVAVVFLLDMSASTAEALDANPNKPPTPSTGPATYGNWRHHRQATQRHVKRKSIIDMEKESAVLLIQVLESIGDTYGIYGFSGYGRDNVEFYVIKDIAERFSERVKRRIDKISPMQATRMGAAIRHTITKLEQQSAATKILFLFSDGRPQDREY